MTIARRKRGQNEGSVYRRADGRWVAVVSLGYRVGKRDRKYLYGRTRREAQQKLTKVLRDLDLGLPVLAEKETVGQYLHRWLDSVAQHKVRANTLRRYRGIVANHVEPNLGRTPLSKLTPHQIATLYGDLLRSGLAPSTVRQVHAVLHSAFKQAVRWNLLVRNPASAVDAPRVPRHRIDPLSLGQVEALLAEAEQDRLHALYVLAVMTGLRQGELLGLQWSDIDWDSAELRVRRQLMRGPEGFEFPEPKTASGRRVVSLPARAVDALRAHRSRQLEERLAAGAGWHDWDLVFCNTVGKPIEGQNLTRRSFKPLLARAGLPPIRFHDLRHTAATLLLAQNVHPKVVQERLGHSQIAVTMDTYSHVMPSMQREAADKLDAMLSG